MIQETSDYAYFWQLTVNLLYIAVEVSEGSKGYKVEPPKKMEENKVSMDEDKKFPFAKLALMEGNVILNPRSIDRCWFMLPFKFIPIVGLEPSTPYSPSSDNSLSFPQGLEESKDCENEKKVNETNISNQRLSSEEKISTAVWDFLKY